MQEVDSLLKEAVSEINLIYMMECPGEVSSFLEENIDKFNFSLMDKYPDELLKKIFLLFSLENKEKFIISIDKKKATNIISNLDINESANLLMRLNKEQSQFFMMKLDKSLQREISEYLSYPEDSAGKIMKKIYHVYSKNLTVGQIIKRIRFSKVTPSLYIYLLDEKLKLKSKVNVQSLFGSDECTLIGSISSDNPAYVSVLSSKSEIMEIFEKSGLASLPVVDANTHVLGIIYSSDLYKDLKEQIVSDIQTMVGVSPEEKALSSSYFAIRKRLPWLCINLLTAFLAAFVVGLFEGLISKFTALAVLLPVVAGQSGNAGAQALAVTMRGLALREVTTREWFKLFYKEIGIGVINGVAIAIICGVGVYFWINSINIALVLSISMVISMVIACISGALTPILLKKLGIDPAQSSSIILTTVTDVVGFFSFLGIGTLMLSMAS